jgi:glycosyltransferase involved in cell wall biosynthesis
MPRGREATLVDVTAVIPTHNRSALLARTLRCALGQRGVDLQVVVVDDGSTDDTAQVVSAADDGRVKMVRHPRATGVSAARNRGIAEASGEWIAFLDDDDLWAPDKLASQLDAARRTGRGWAYGGAVAVTSSLEVVSAGPPPTPERVAEGLPYRNMVPAGASNVVVRRDALERVGGFDPALRHMSDWDLWIRLGQSGLPAAVNAPVVAYRLHPGNASAQTWDIPAEMEVVERRYAALRRGAPVDRAYVYRWIAWNSLRSGNRREAVRAYARAVRAGDLKSIGRAAVGLARPQAIQASMRRGSHRLQEEAAAAWLRPFAVP